MVTRFGLAVVSIGLSAVATHAATIASDAGDNYPLYSQYSGVNGGKGFLAWVNTPAANSGLDGQFINTGSYDPTGLPGQFFDLYENGTGTLNSDIATNERPFAAALNAGETFSFTDVLHYANGVDGSGNPTSLLGFHLLDGNGSSVFTFAVSGGGAGYQLTDKTQSGVVETAVPYNYQSADTFAFTLLDAAGDYSFTVTGANVSGGTQTVTGQVDLSGGAPSTVAIFNNDGGYSSDLQFSNLQITPEPGMLSAGAIALSLLRRRARR